MNAHPNADLTPTELIQVAQSLEQHACLIPSRELEVAKLFDHADQLRDEAIQALERQTGKRR